MTRPLLSTAVTLLLAGVAAAQTAPAGQPPTPGEGSGSAAPTEQTPPATTAPPTTEPAAPPDDSPIKTEEPKKDDKPAVLAKYDGGTKFYTEDEKFELKLSFRNQVRFEATRPLEDNKQFLDTFYIPRARLQAEGHLFGKDNRFKVEAGLGDGGSFAFLKDMYLEKRLPDSPLYVRFGQWKRPFNRAEMVSDFSSTFNERSIQNELAGGGRSLGVAVHNDYEKSPEGIEWAFGVFDTFSGGSDRPGLSTTCTQDATTMTITCVNSRPSTFPSDFGPTVVARVGFNSPKIKGYSESDLEGGPLRYAVGASYKVDLANLAEGKQDSWAHNMSHGIELDAMVKAMGYAVTGGVVLMKIKQADAAWGLYLQPSMFITPKKFELAARFAINSEATVSGMVVDRKQIEMRLAPNYYWHGHTWKLASDVGFLKLLGDPKDDPDLQLRVMMQLQI